MGLNWKIVKGDDSRNHCAECHWDLRIGSISEITFAAHFVLVNLGVKGIANLANVS